MKTRARLVGLLATLLIVAILIGLPVTLLALGANPIPTSVPTLEHLRAAVTTPDDGTLALGAITVLAWAAWLVLTASILLEAAARLRGARAPRLPGFSMPQVAARQLVGAAALLFVVAPATATFAGHPSPRRARHPATAPAAPVPAAPAPARPATPARPARPGRPTPRTYVVRPGDTLSGIARRELGAAGRWRDLVDLNPAVAANPDRIHAGTVLLLPAPPAAAEHTYTVRAGDTLSGIARRELGDPGRYPEIFTASKDTPQPGGGHLSDPDAIDVGQTLTIPATGTPHTQPAAAGPGPHRQPPPRRPGPTRTGWRPRRHQPAHPQRPPRRPPRSRPASPAAPPAAARNPASRPRTRRGCSPGSPAPGRCWPGPCGCCCAAAATPSSDTGARVAPWRPRHRCSAPWRRRSPPSAPSPRPPSSTWTSSCGAWRPPPPATAPPCRSSRPSSSPTPTWCCTCPSRRPCRSRGPAATTTCTGGSTRPPRPSRSARTSSTSRPPTPCSSPSGSATTRRCGC